MRISTALHFISELIGGTISILIADRLGSFANSIIANNLSLGMDQLGPLLFYLMISILAVPAFGLLGNWAMLKAAFTHEYMLLERFLDKTYDTATLIEEGEIANRLEDDAIDLRCFWVLILTIPYIAMIFLPFVLNLAIVRFGKYVIEYLNRYGTTFATFRGNIKFATLFCD